MISIENEITYIKANIDLQNQKKSNLLKILEEICSILEKNTGLNNLSELLSILDDLKLSLEKNRYSIDKLEEIETCLSFDISTEKYTELLEKYKKAIIENDIFIEKFFNKYLSFLSLNQGIQQEQQQQEQQEQQEQTQDLEQPQDSEPQVEIQQPQEQPKTEIQLQVQPQTEIQLQEQPQTQLQPQSVEPEEKHLIKLEDNDTLLISETKQKVYLPYKIHDLEKTLQKSNKYNNIEEIINDKYILPISRFKNSMFSRFREAFNLMRIKEKASFADSLSLALELSVNTYLNPAIITACSNIDELDIYLDYLSENQTEKFKIFKIEYEVLPIKK